MIPSHHIAKLPCEILSASKFVLQMRHQKVSQTRSVFRATYLLFTNDAANEVRHANMTHYSSLNHRKKNFKNKKFKI